MRLPKTILALINHPLMTGSLIMVIGSNLVNAFNYFYHLIIGRLLGPEGYSELAALFSLIVLLSVLPGAFAPVIVKYISAAKSDDEIASLWGWFHRLMWWLGISMTFILLLISPLLKDFLHVDINWHIWLVAIASGIALPLTANRSVLIGLMQFHQHVFNGLAENTIKLGLGVGLIFLGWMVSGAMTALVLGYGFALLLTFWQLKKYRTNVKLVSVDRKDIYKYALPVFMQSLAMMSLMSVDIILVRHLFSAETAGVYAGMSTMGRIIFYASGAVGSVMFPLVSARYSRGEAYRTVFLLSLLMVSLMVVGLLIIYSVFPEIMISLLYGSAYLSGEGSLVWFGLMGGLLALNSLYISYNLALKRTRVVGLVVLAAAAQVIGILWWHQSIESVIILSVTITALLLAGLVIYSAYADQANINHRSSLQAR